jgi:hypothetical protein
LKKGQNIITGLHNKDMRRHEVNIFVVCALGLGFWRIEGAVAAGLECMVVIAIDDCGGGWMSETYHDPMIGECR